MPSNTLPAKRFARGSNGIYFRFGAQELRGEDRGDKVVYTSFTSLIAVYDKATDTLYEADHSYNPTDHHPHSPTTRRHLRGLRLEHYGAAVEVRTLQQLYDML